jgi:hypothetical protein
MVAAQASRLDCDPTDAGGFRGKARLISASDRLNDLAVRPQR